MILGRAQTRILRSLQNAENRQAIDERENKGLTTTLLRHRTNLLSSEVDKALTELEVIGLIEKFNRAGSGWYRLTRNGWMAVRDLP